MSDSPLRLLAVLAHPDDESFGPGGSLAKAVTEGVDVHLLTVTDGAAGTAEGLEGAELATVRTHELEGAARELGVTLHRLDHRDSGFHDEVAGSHEKAFVNVDFEQLVGEIGEYIQRLRPHVVLTHDETGGYGHPDHVRCHEATLAAFRSAAPWKPQRLYCEVSSDRWMKVAAASMRLFGKDPTAVGENNDIDLTKVGVPASSITTRVDIRGQWAAKKAAQARHESQGGGPPHTRYLPVWMLRVLFPTETFLRVEPASAGPRETSLFEGLA
ncbi:MAG: GlcNAc-PI de-N-acetylase [Acidimicrobiia bacterium]|nr:GlcNAc-PI de-N-acetylase [Acidimicrobiia bacterium]